MKAVTRLIVANHTEFSMLHFLLLEGKVWEFQVKDLVGHVLEFGEVTLWLNTRGRNNCGLNIIERDLVQVVNGTHCHKDHIIRMILTAYVIPAAGYLESGINISRSRV